MKHNCKIHGSTSFDGGYYLACGCEATTDNVANLEQRSFIRGIRNGCLFSAPFWLVIIAVVVSCSGCSTVRPLSEYQHVSHASDGLGGPGFDTLSLGIRWRPYDGVQVDLLEGYSPNGLDGQKEIFTGRVTVEF